MAGKPVRTPWTIAPCRIGKVHLGGYYEPSLADALKKIAIQEQTTMNELIAEGLGAVIYARSKNGHKVNGLWPKARSKFRAKNDARIGNREARILARALYELGIVKPGEIA